MPYIPNTDNDRQEMLKQIGVKSVEELFSNIPESLRLKRPLDIESLSEMELLSEIKNISKESREGLICFAGGGVYDHFRPSAVDTIISRPEFMTAYTPYQPEVAQGTLQVIYEFQTHICRLTGMDIANASMYDGASAAAEAALLAMRVTKRQRVLVSETVSPFYRQVLNTYLSGHNAEMIVLSMDKGMTDFEQLHDTLDDSFACLILAQPNFFGLIENSGDLSDAVHKVGAKLIMAVDPIAQALLKTPADYGADIVVGEGQPLGLSLSFGGPMLGFFAVRKELARQVPGRIAGRTKDVDGRSGFVLTLQTREQHIRREKATSNICTNQALCATAATVYMTLMGKTGLRKVALLSMERAHQAFEKIIELEGFEPYFEGPFVREFPVRTPKPAQEVILTLIEHGLVAGIDAGRWFSGLNDCLIVAATEKRTTGEVAQLVSGLKGLSVSNAVSKV